MLRTLVFAAAMVLASTASAQAQAPENGLGPYRFGMGVGEAMATSPNAAWTMERRDEADVLTGGPPVEIGGRFSTALVFFDDRLRRIVLVASTPGACVDAVGEFVRTVEPLYGAFNSIGPYILEIGVLQQVARTEDGSEIRVREMEGVNFAISARHGDDMYVAVRGDPSAEGCRVTVTLGASSPDWERVDSGPGPAWAEIDAAQSLPNPEYSRRPSANTFANYYPHEALLSNISGVVALDCIVREEGRLDCRVVEESPVREGFGAAAIAIARDFRVRHTDDAVPVVGRRLRVPIRFNTGQ